MTNNTYCAIPLQWTHEEKFSRAKTDLGWYEIWKYSQNDMYRFTLHTFDDEIDGNFFSTREEAIADAQSHFESRLLKNLIPKTKT